MLLRIPVGAGPDFAYAAFTLFGPPFQAVKLSGPVSMAGSYNPGRVLPVWALPLSLATTYGIDFSFFSSAY